MIKNSYPKVGLVLIVGMVCASLAIILLPLVAQAAPSARSLQVASVPDPPPRPTFTPGLPPRPTVTPTPSPTVTPTPTLAPTVFYIPEPTTMLLVVAGLAGLGGLVGLRRRQ